MDILTQNFDYAQYLQDAEDSKVSPLPRRLLVGFEHVGLKIECFALPGLENKPKRYVLSQFGCCNAIKKSNSSIISFLGSKMFKSLYSKDFPIIMTFYVTGSNKPIEAIPGWVARAYWRQQDKLKNPIASDIIDTLIDSKLDDLADLTYEIIRTPQQRIENFKNTWEIVRNKTRRGYKTMENSIWNYFAQEFYSTYESKKARTLSNKYIETKTEALLTTICCEIVRSLTGERPMDIYNELKLNGESPNKQELRDWYSQELLEAIEGVQIKLIQMFQANPQMIGDFDVEAVVGSLAAEYGVIDWHPNV